MLNFTTKGGDNLSTFKKHEKTTTATKHYVSDKILEIWSPDA